MVLYWFPKTHVRCTTAAWHLGGKKGSAHIGKQHSVRKFYKLDHVEKLNDLAGMKVQMLDDPISRELSIILQEGEWIYTLRRKTFFWNMKSVWFSAHKRGTIESTEKEILQPQQGQYGYCRGHLTARRTRLLLISGGCGKKTSHLQHELQKCKEDNDHLAPM